MKKSIIKAFTLVELLVVIAIVAILSTVGIMGYNSFTVKAYVSNDETKAELINRHLQIHQMDYPLNTEEDLKLVIDQMYGQEAFDKLAPQSAEYGYHYWFNIETKQVKLSRVEDLTNNVSNVNYLSRTSKFDTKNSFRANLVSGYMLLDRSGSAIADALSLIENIETVEDYELVIKNVKKAKNSKEDQRLGAILENALKSTTIIANEGTFRYVDVENVNNIYYTNATTTISSLLHEYDGKNVTSSYLSNVNNKVVATGNEFVLPSNITNIESYGLHFASSNTVLKTSLTENQLLDVFKANATNAIIEAFKDEIVNQYKIENGTLKNITSDTVVGTPSYSNPVQDGDFEIICIEDNNGFVKHNKVENILYVSYDQKTFNLSTEFLNDEVSSQEVTWTSSNSEIIEIDDNGKATINKLPEIGGKYEVSLRATALAGEHYEEITAYIVRPTHGNITLGDTYTLVVNNFTNGNTIDILYDGETSLFNFTDLYLSYNINDLVSCNENYEITTNGTIFDITGDSDNGYSLKLNEFDGTQTFTIKVGNYLEKEFTVNVIDNSESPFNLKFTNTDKYMYRLGNANEVKLSSLFGLIEGKNITNKTIKFDIYDASKTTGDNKLTNIATSGDGFSATYTNELTSSNWENSTIKFNGSGVAIMEIGVGNLSTRLVVEVIDGKNITSQADFSGRDADQNIVILNNMNITTTVLVTNSSIFGNGFALDGTTYTTGSNNAIIMLTNGTIDNTIINGPVIPEVVYASDRDSGYYFMTVEIRSGNCTISNSYISGGRSAIKIVGGNVLIDNSTIEGGVYSNIEITTCNKLTLRDVTTIQNIKETTVGEKKKVMGAGIVFTKNATESTAVVIEGYLNQYNWAKESDKNYLPSLVKANFSSIFGNSNYSSYIHNINNVDYFNTGLVFEGTRQIEIIDNRNDKLNRPYSIINVSSSLLGTEYTASIYTLNNSNGHVTIENITPSIYVSSKQNIFKPVFKFTNVGTLPEENATYSYYYDGKVHIAIPNGGNYDFNVLEGLSISKYSKDYAINVDALNLNIVNDVITFDTKGNYEIVYKVTDNIFYDINGNLVNKTVDYEYVVEVEVNISTIKDAEISIDISKMNYIYAATDAGCNGDADYYLCIPVLQGLTIVNYTADGKQENVAINLGALPENLTVTGSCGKYITSDSKFKTYNNTLYLCSDEAVNNPDSKDVVLTYTYVGGNGKTVTASVTVSFTSSTNSSTKWSSFK